MLAEIMNYILIAFLWCITTTAFALVAGYEPDVRQIELLARGRIQSVTTGDFRDSAIQICQINIEFIEYDKFPEQHNETITLIYNCVARAEDRNNGINHADETMVGVFRRKLVVGDSMYFPVKWSKDLMAYICYDRWDGVWELNDSDYKKVIKANSILKPE
jgi:hypothetical protein